MKIIMFYYFRTFQATPIRFAVKIVRLKVYIIFSQSDDPALHSRSQLRLKRDKCVTCTITAISRTIFNLWHDGKRIHGISTPARFDDLDLGARSFYF